MGNSANGATSLKRGHPVAKLSGKLRLLILETWELPATVLYGLAGDLRGRSTHEFLLAFKNYFGPDKSGCTHLREPLLTIVYIFVTEL